MTARRGLSTRRESETHAIVVEGATFSVTVGYFGDGAPGEIFMAGPKVGSALDAVLADAAILASLALQYGAPPAALAKSMSRVPSADPWSPATAPASPIAAAMDLIAALGAAS